MKAASTRIRGYSTRPEKITGAKKSVEGSAQDASARHPEVEFGKVRGTRAVGGQSGVAEKADKRKILPSAGQGVARWARWLQ